MKADLVYDFADQWNQQKARGMDCSREEMMRDQNLELTYIAGCLYGNIKPR